MVKSSIDILPFFFYNNKKEAHMSSIKTLESLGEFCNRNSGDSQIWSGKSGTYYWNVGRSTPGGLVNGVVRKLAGTDVNGTKIWTVAGSFKIADDGTILRFTGLAKKDQNLISRLSSVKIEAQQLVKETV
jgi:hypothetical protein